MELRRRGRLRPARPAAVTSTAAAATASGTVTARDHLRRRSGRVPLVAGLRAFVLVLVWRGRGRRLLDLGLGHALGERGVVRARRGLLGGWRWRVGDARRLGRTRGVDERDHPAAAQLDLLETTEPG